MKIKDTYVGIFFLIAIIIVIIFTFCAMKQELQSQFPQEIKLVYYQKEEFLNQELTHLNTYAVEGMAWLDKDYFANMLNDKKQKALLELIQITENDSYLLPFSPHMMIAVKKQLSYGK